MTDFSPPLPPSEFTVRRYKQIALKALAAYPNLDAAGFDSYRRRTRVTAAGGGYNVDGREDLLNLAYPRVASLPMAWWLCIEFMNHEPFDGMVGRTASSYGLKHAVEVANVHTHPAVHIPNGVLILALIHLGYPFLQYGPNAIVATPAHTRYPSLGQRVRRNALR